MDSEGVKEIDEICVKNLPWSTMMVKEKTTA